MVIEGKVAVILNERELIINKGAEAGVKEGMKFKIVEPKVDIKDPDTGEALGTLTHEKIRVGIVEVQPKFSKARTYETFVGYFPAPLPKLPLLPSPPPVPVTRVRTLKYAGALSDTPFLDYLSVDFVKVGDLVVQVDDNL
jgi:hypothetical protein